MFRARNLSGLQAAVVCAVALTLWFESSGIARAQDPDKKPAVGYGVAITGPGGLYAYVPNRWGLMHVNVVNRQTEPMDLFSATYFDDEPTLQYGRKIWLPARSRLRSWHPVKLPAKTAPDGKTVYFHSLVMDAGKDQEVLIRTDSGQMAHDGMLQVARDVNTGMISHLGADQPRDFEDSFDLVGIGRTSQLLSRRISSLTDPVFLPGEESLQALDQLVINDSRPMTDAAGLTAIRRWLHRGGNLWVMLEQVDPRMLEMLIGDDFNCQVVDRVSLTRVRIESGIPSQYSTVAQTDFDRPVDMARVLVSDVEIACTVNGWPAAFWKNCGDGKLLVTTLGPRAWMQPRPPSTGSAAPRSRPGTREIAAEPASGEILGKYVPNELMVQLAAEFFKPAKPEPIAPSVMEPIAQEYVGYSIPSRWLIIGLLVGFSGLLVAAGVWLWRLGRLEWLGAIGPVVAIVISLVLIGAGRQQRHAVPPTAASLQFIRAIPGTDDFLAEGQLGLFSQDTGQTTLGAHNSGWVSPDMAGLQGTTRRMIWTDMDQWQWLNLPAMAGSRNATFRSSGEFPQRVSATAMFGPDGLHGQLQTGSDHRPADALVATVGGRISAEIIPDGKFYARSATVFSGEQFLAADLLSDEQNRRRKILQQLLTNPQRSDYPHQPTLLFWTDAWDLGLEFDPKARSLGSALVAVPLHLQRPPTGTEVWIASPFLGFRPVTGPDGARPSGMYDPRTREWTEKSWPSAIWLRFQVPPVLLPLQSLSGRMVVQMTGPIGKLEVAGVRQGKVESLKTWVDPVGTVELPITDGDLLTLDAAGGILLRIGGGDPDRPELTKTETSDGPKTNYWRIESVTFDLKAKTIGIKN